MLLFPRLLGGRWKISQGICQQNKRVIQRLLLFRNSPVDLDRDQSSMVLVQSLGTPGWSNVQHIRGAPVLEVQY